MKRFEKGSEWRKWDFHVHTPASILNQQFGSDWDIYVQKLFKKAIKNNISAIGITDYFSIEGYKKIKNEYLANKEKMTTLFSLEEVQKISNIYIFPNIEFRIEKFIQGKVKELQYDRKLNYHVLLSGEIPINQIEEQFLQGLKFDYEASPGESAEKMRLSLANLRLLGQRIKVDQPEFGKYCDLYVGTMNASVNENDIINELKHPNFKDKFLLVLPTDEDLSNVQWGSQGHTARKNLIKQAHCFFSANPKTISFGLGKFDCNFIKEFNSLKPCIWGSDAHDYDKMFNPDLHRYTWIKADLNFNGLRQVIYDPKSRVYIGNSSPQQKSEYLLIDKVRFIDNSNNKIFTPNWINLNPDLNTIIGGKSSGKSLLLYHIAKAINSDEVKQKCDFSSNVNYSYDKNSNFDFEVLWSNGSISRLSEIDEVSPITYIPQMYINYLAEKQGQKDLNSLVKEVLCQNKDFDDFLFSKTNKISQLNQEITIEITKLCNFSESYHLVFQNMIQIGKETAIQEEINKIGLSITHLRQKSGFTKNEEDIYKTQTNRLTSLNKRKSLYQKVLLNNKIIKDSNKSYKNFIIDNYLQQMKSITSSPSFEFFPNKFKRNFQCTIDQLFDNFELFLSQNELRLVNKIDKIGKEITTIEHKLSPLSKKIGNQNELKNKLEKLKVEEDKLEKIIDHKKQLEIIKTSGFNSKEKLSILYQDLINCYKSISEEVQKPAHQLNDNIKIDAEVSFNQDIFKEFISGLDTRFTLGEIETYFGDNYIFKFDLNTHLDTITKFNEEIRSKKFKEKKLLRSGITEEKLLQRLYANCFYIDYKIYYKDDEMAHMSPGKRGLVLLNLLLHLSNSTHPILIDQPEDNLDNRTIYDELNVFIRERKLKRQIIMVTHNANLVVAADAECVIVANQSGQQSNRDNEGYKFEYCTGSLELSFEKLNEKGLLNQKGIKEHVCEILEGGVAAFKERELKYGFSKNNG